MKRCVKSWSWFIVSEAKAYLANASILTIAFVICLNQVFNYMGPFNRMVRTETLDISLLFSSAKYFLTTRWSSEALRKIPQSEKTSHTQQTSLQALRQEVNLIRRSAVRPRSSLLPWQDSFQRHNSQIYLLFSSYYINQERIKKN